MSKKRTDINMLQYQCINKTGVFYMTLKRKLLI